MAGPPLCSQRPATNTFVFLRTYPSQMVADAPLELLWTPRVKPLVKSARAGPSTATWISSVRCIRRAMSRLETHRAKSSEFGTSGTRNSATVQRFIPETARLHEEVGSSLDAVRVALSLAAGPPGAERVG